MKRIEKGYFCKKEDDPFVAAVWSAGSIWICSITGNLALGDQKCFLLDQDRCISESLNELSIFT